MDEKRRYTVGIPRDKAWAMEGLTGDLGIYRGCRGGKIIIETEEEMVKVLQALLTPDIVIAPERAPGSKTRR